ncbi:MAG: DUF4982 domain-containing protein [Muribaculum sp.]|nr:DUF4982 domain-containing protein [Muribaculaceae bacterium]MCM1080393.1 DUF4982 domain-containing protein [Muribaculum sp.]
MKLIYTSLLMASAIVSLCASAQRSIEQANRDWKFTLGDIAEAQKTDFDDSKWQTVNIPHDFQIHQPWVAPSADERPDSDNPVANVRSRLSSRGFKEMGAGWYRKTFTPSDDWQGRRVLLDFEGIMLVGDVYLNGQRVGGTDYGYLGFEVDITDKLKFGQPNVIAVKADTGKPENSRWYTGGGLFRDVKFVITPANRYFTRHPLYVTTPVAEADSATISVQAELFSTAADNSPIDIRLTVLDPDGQQIYCKTSSRKFNKRQNPWEYKLADIKVANPKRWSCETPVMYKAIAELVDSTGKAYDVAETNFGIRKLEFSPEYGFKLNGQKLVLKGIANHHTLGALGAAAYPRAMEKRIQLLKDYGFNHIRTSHNPYSESFLDLCDQNGILVLDELYDKWMQQYAGGRTSWEDQWQYTIPEWIKRDRNHPSVIIWSLGNELQIQPELPLGDYGVTPYLMQKPLVKRYDNTRPLTVAMHPHGRGMDLDSEPWPLAKLTDIASYNYRYMFFPNDGKRYPHMNFYQSEASMSAMGPNYFEMDLDKNIGLAYWGAIDYLGESNGWPEKGWANGAFDLSLEPKPSAYFLRSYFKPDEPIVHIAITGKRKSVQWNGIDVGTAAASNSWNMPKGAVVDIYTYTNADEVELLVNGKSLGRQKNNIADPKQRNRILWKNVTYTPGKIQAKAYKNGNVKPIATHQLETTGAAKKLTAAADNNQWKADGIDLQHVRIEAVDNSGRQDKEATAKIKFAIEGPAEIVGVINGDIKSNELTVGDSRSLYNGTVTVILRSTPEAGIVTLTAQPEGKIKGTTLKLNTIN